MSNYSRKWLTTQDVADILDVSVRTVERWRSESKLTPDRHTSGGHSRYSHEQVEKMREHKKLKVIREQKITEKASSSHSFELPTHEEFVKYVYNFLEEADIKPSMFGRKVLNDSGSIQRLKEGTDPRLSTLHKICEEIEKIRKRPMLKKMLQEMME